MGSEFSSLDKVRVVNALSELPQLRREASSIASAIDRQTRELKEEMLSIRCWLAAIMAVIMLGILVACCLWAMPQ